MNTKSIALAITFAAVAIVLNTVKIPAVFYPNNFFQLTQIPVVVAFLLFGVRFGVSVGVLNLIGSFALFPFGTAGLILYPMDFISLLLTFAGLYLASVFIAKNNDASGVSHFRRPAVGLTVGALATRGGLMPLVDYGVLNHILLPLILGFQRSEAAMLALVPVFVLFNVIVVLYTVPVAFFVANRIGRYLKIEPRLFSRV